MNNTLNIAIITTSVRENRVSPTVASWTKKVAENQNFDKVKFQIVDLADYNLPIFLSKNPEKLTNETKKWKSDLAKFDAYIFVVAEYNHAITGAFKNALDFLETELKDKPAGFVSYGGVGGARAVENLRLILAELSVATVQRNVHFLLAYDFENFSIFKPQDFHKNNLKQLLNQLIKWANALKTIR